MAKAKRPCIWGLEPLDKLSNDLIFNAGFGEENCEEIGPARVIWWVGDYDFIRKVRSSKRAGHPPLHFRVWVRRGDNAKRERFPFLKELEK